MRIALAIATVLVGHAAAPSPSRLVLQPAQVGKGYQMLARTDGRGVKGTVTMNLCGIGYPSERLRKARLQVDYATRTGALGLSNEVVAYREGGAAQAMSEVSARAANCPAKPVPSGLAGIPPLRYEITRLRVPGLLKGYLAIRVRTMGTVNGRRVDLISYAVYQRLGNVLSGVYSSGPDTVAQRDFAFAAARESAKNLRHGNTPQTPAA
jgi:hypothetical protein